MTRVYLFSVTNPLEVEGGGKPHLDQVGPFTYSEQVERVGEVFRADGSVSYQTRRTWHHLPGQSLPLDTPVTSLDVPMLAAAEAARGDWWMVSWQPSCGTLPNRAPYQEFGLSSLLTTRTSLFTNVTAGQLLFEGYYDPLLELGNMYMDTGDTGGDGSKEDKFGWMVGRNGTSGADGVVTMDTGQMAK